MIARLRRRLRRIRDDAGAMLVMALIVITTVALVTGAVLTHAGANFHATVSLRGVAATSYAGDAAAKVAINHLELGAQAPGWVAPTFDGSWSNWVFTHNADGTGCFGVDAAQAPQDKMELKSVQAPAGDQTTATSARVECTVVPGTGLFAAGNGVGITDPDPSDPFSRALTTVGTSGTRQGISLKPLGTGNTAALPIRGGIASESFIDVDNGSLTSDGYVWAEGPCTGTGTIIATDKVCSSPGKVPAYATPPSPLTSVPAWRDPTTMGCTFQPGFYNNAKALSDAVNACSIAKFTSGKYYFDFADEALGTGQNIWTMGKSSGTNYIIGGEYVGTTIPGACKSPTTNDPVAGVQFVFGSNSRVQVLDSARVELCGPSNGGAAPMTLYQQQTGSSPGLTSIPTSGTVAPSNATTLGPAAPGKNDAFTPANPASSNLTTALSAVGGPNAAWKSTKNGNTGELDLKFSALAGIPTGATITSAKLNVTYNKTLLKTTARFTAGVNSQPGLDIAPSGTDTDITATLAAEFLTGSFSATNPTIKLAITDSDKNDTMTVDAVSLKVTYLDAALRKAVDLDPGFLINPGGNFAGKFVVQGATFVPNGYVSLLPGSAADALVSFRWGLVALGATFKAQPSQTFGYPLVSIPNPGRGLGTRVTVVDLKVFVCVQQTSCGSGGTHALTTRVMITDPPYSAPTNAPVPGRRKITVLSWAEQH